MVPTPLGYRWYVQQAQRTPAIAMKIISRIYHMIQFLSIGRCNLQVAGCGLHVAGWEYKEMRFFKDITQRKLIILRIIQPQMTTGKSFSDYH